MKRITITTLTIGLISLVILLIATMLAQRMSKEGLAGAGGIPARFFTSGTMQRDGGPKLTLDSNLTASDGKPMFDVPLPKQGPGETWDDFQNRLSNEKYGWGNYYVDVYEDNTWYELEYVDGKYKGTVNSIDDTTIKYNDFLNEGLSFDDTDFKSWNRKSPLRITLDYVRKDDEKRYTSSYYFYDGIFTYDWPPPKVPADPVYDPDTRELPAASDPNNWSEADMVNASEMERLGMPITMADEHGMGGHGMGGPGGRRPIVINVNNTGGAYAPQGSMAQPAQSMSPSELHVTHELSKNAEKKITKTMNFMEFVIKSSQK
jgi:hypothetical protein